MNNLQEFKFNENEVRIIEIDNNPWFVLKDVCAVLDIKNTTDVAKRLEEDEVTRFNLGGLSGETNIVNESGLYTVILRSDKPQAKSFRKWVTSEVLPSIRKTGSYQTPTNPMQALELMFGAMKENTEKVEAIETRVTEIEENAPLSASEYNCISQKISDRVRNVLDPYKPVGRQAKSVLYKAINSDIKVIAGVRNRSQLKQKDFNKVYDFIQHWEPSQAVMILFKERL